MKKMKFLLLILLGILSGTSTWAHVDPGTPKRKPKKENREASYRSDCSVGVSQIDLDINNVRARLLTGGDFWWDGGNGRYIVPKVPEGSGLPEVSAIFAGGIWLGGVDPGGNLKVACQTYGHFNGSSDFWPGPLTDEGQVGADTCKNWDRFFTVLGTSVIQYRENWRAAVAEAKAAGGTAADARLTPDQIPQDIKGWPGLGNPFFYDIHGFELPGKNKGFNGMAGFWDVGGAIGTYEPQFGDFPILNVRGCVEENRSFPDRMDFWIYNDGAGIHSQSNGDAILMEVQVQAFAYEASDQINNMTFQAYRLVNRAIEDIDSTYFGIWVDPDLGCFSDDYIGCDSTRNLGYVYNADDLDGNDDCDDCGASVNTYCSNIPALGIDFFRGPLDEFGVEIGMSSFTYYNNSALNPIPATTDPQEAVEYYNYLSGSWRDGTRFTYGGDGYDPYSTNYTNYVFTGRPDDDTAWSMCSEAFPIGNDYRTIQASGPFTLTPGAINELIFGVVWVPSIDYPCPNLDKFFRADDLAQDLFDNCFPHFPSVDAPDVDWVELDEEIIAVFTNENTFSNNYKENYFEADLYAPRSDDSIYYYQFEGYKLYQLPDGHTPEDWENPEQARLVAQVDIKNGINTIYNWESVTNPNRDLPGEPLVIFQPVEKVAGADEGLQHTFRITDDAFGGGKLINHRTYYFTAIAYAYNNWETFSQQDVFPEGQSRSYISSHRNIRLYPVVPRPIVDVRLNSAYGDGPQVTRLEGAGVGGNFVEISEESRDAILNGTSDGTITYKPGQGPINIKIYNPLEIKDGEFKLYLKDDDLTDTLLAPSATWELVNLTTNEVIASDRTIKAINEQIIGEYGFSISIAQTQDAGDKQSNNGALGLEVTYADEQGEQWFQGIQDGDFPYNFIKTEPNEIDNAEDPQASFANLMSPGYWQPYQLVDYRPFLDNNFLITPAWDHQIRSPVIRFRGSLNSLNNVDIVMTADKSKWSRCVVVETASRLYYDENVGSGKPTDDGTRMFDLRRDPSVSKYDGDGDGQADVDGSETREGFGWFPGYAIDVETGQRLNIFFGENTTYSCESLTEVGLGDWCSALPNNGQGNGRDMMWNPSADVLINATNRDKPLDLYPYITGGQHFIYVTGQAYDGCEQLHPLFERGGWAAADAILPITWTCMPLATTLDPLGAGETGLIPNDLTFKLRVDNPYQVAAGNGENSGHPAYQFSFRGVEKEALVTQEEFDEELANINIVPNPYYGYSIYETSQFTNTVKITNLPAVCEVNIYSLDGRFIRQYRRNEQSGSPKGKGIAMGQINPDLEWDLKNANGISIASGTYLIHVAVENKGERVLKFFAVQGQFDPSGL